MTVQNAKRFSDGAGLALGAIEIECMFGGPRTSLHGNLYKKGVTVDEILMSKVTVPNGLKPGLKKLNQFMKR